MLENRNMIVGEIVVPGPQCYQKMWNCGQMTSERLGPMWFDSQTGGTNGMRSYKC
jgi:hypothetical protein